MEKTIKKIQLKGIKNQCYLFALKIAYFDDLKN